MDRKQLEIDRAETVVFVTELREGDVYLVRDRNEWVSVVSREWKPATRRHVVQCETVAGEPAEPFSIGAGQRVTVWRLRDKPARASSSEYPSTVTLLREIVNRCEAHARRGTGYGMCEAPLDEHGNCPNAGNHVEMGQVFRIDLKRGNQGT